MVAAGNSGENANGHSPANFGDSVITVSAIADWDGEPGAKGVPQFGIMSYPQEDDALAFFSSDGALVDVAAPGVGVLSTYPGDRFAVSSGTSMSTPAVSGSVVRALACGMTAEELLDYSADYNSAWTGDVDGFHEPLVIIPEGC